MSLDDDSCQKTDETDPHQPGEEAQKIDNDSSETDKKDEEEKKSLEEESREKSNDENCTNPTQSGEDVDMIDANEDKKEESNENNKKEIQASLSQKSTTENFDESEIKPDIKKEEVKIKLNFMRKFSTSVGKLSRSDLEELLLEKITEAIVFRTESAELRTKCEKQDEIIDNLKQRIQSITKQYNDLDMIHKRIMKDLKEKPDQPITPVKITRAVGLQVYQPQTSNNSNNLKKIQSAPLNTQIKNNSNANTNINPVNKRPNESDLNDKEAEAKRKKSNKIITPMRPPLSEKERASLEKQEATIEQKIRTKVIKPDIIASTSSSATKPVTNGMPNKTQR